jgi:hypothetical protein
VRRRHPLVGRSRGFGRSVGALAGDCGQGCACCRRQCPSIDDRARGRSRRWCSSVDDRARGRSRRWCAPVDDRPGGRGRRPVAGLWGKQRLGRLARSVGPIAIAGVGITRSRFLISGPRGRKFFDHSESDDNPLTRAVPGEFPQISDFLQEARGRRSKPCDCTPVKQSDNRPTANRCCVLCTRRHGSPAGRAGDLCFFAAGSRAAAQDGPNPV